MTALDENRPLLAALEQRPVNLNGHVLVRRDGRVVDAYAAREDDWRDLDAQLDEEARQPPV